MLLQERCTEDEFADYSLMMFYAIAQNNAVNCTQHQYHSDSCEQGNAIDSGSPRYRRSVTNEDMLKVGEEMLLLQEVGIDIPQFEAAGQVLQMAKILKK